MRRQKKLDDPFGVLDELSSLTEGEPAPQRKRRRPNQTRLVRGAAVHMRGDERLRAACCFSCVCLMLCCGPLLTTIGVFYLLSTTRAVPTVVSDGHAQNSTNSSTMQGAGPARLDGRTAIDEAQATACITAGCILMLCTCVASRRRDCHFADTPSSSLLKNLLKEKGVQ